MKNNLRTLGRTAVSIGFALALASPVMVVGGTAAAQVEPDDLSGTAAESHTAATIASVSPGRFADTRSAGSTIDGQFQAAGVRSAGSNYRVQIAGRGAVPADAAGVIVNATAVGPAAKGFLTLHPCLPSIPTTSSLNYEAGVNIGNEVVASLSSDGSICVFTDQTSHITLDVVGYVPSGSDLTPISPKRVLDTRPAGSTVDGLFANSGRTAAGSTTRVKVADRAGVPSGVANVLANVTAINPQARGFVVAHACLATTPPTSSLNFESGVNRANDLVIPVSAAGEICIFTSESIHLAVDVSGYVPPGTSLNGITGARMVDTRPGNPTVDGQYAGEGRRTAGSQYDVQIAGRGDVPSDATAVVVNVTAINPSGVGYMTVHPCVSPLPLASSLNYTGGANGGNEIIAGLSDDGTLCVFTNTPSHLTLDVTGYFGPPPVVNHPPVITSPAARAAAENQTTIATLTATDEDLPAQPLAWSVSGGADASLFAISAAGVLTFVDAPNYEAPTDANADGVYVVDVQVTDGQGGVTTQTVSITVADVNDAPVIISDGGGANATVPVAEGQTAATDVQAIDDELNTENGGGLTYSLTTIGGRGTDNGLFTLNTGTGVITFNTAPDFETPADANFDSRYELQVTVTDVGKLTDTQDITFVVTNGNEAPVITSNGGGSTAAVPVVENQTAVTTVQSTDDTDSDGAGLTYSLSPTGSSFDNARFIVDPATGILTFKSLAGPDFEKPGDSNGDNDYEVHVTVTDSGAPGLTDTQIIVVTVTDINEAPAATNGSVTALEDTTFTFASGDFAFTDVDAGATLRSVTITVLPAAGALQLDGLDVTLDQVIPVGDITDLTYLPIADGNGSPYDTFGFTVNDGSLDSVGTSTMTIDVTPVNDAPSFTGGGDVGDDPLVLEDSGAYSAAWATALVAGPGELQTLSFVVTRNTNASLFSASPAVNAAGELGFTPAANANGFADITIELRDDGGTANGGDNDSAPVTFRITVTSVNDAPSFTKGSDVTVGEDSGAYSDLAWATALSTGPADESGQTPLAFTVVAANPALFSAGPAVSATGTLSFTPAANSTGSTSVSVFVIDTGGTANGGVDTSATQTFTITITEANDAPVAVEDRYLVDEGATLVVSGVDGVRSNDTDTEDVTPSGAVILVRAPLRNVGAFELNTDGSFTYVHDGSETLGDSFTYFVTDSAGATSNVATAMIEVNPVNDPPVAVDDAYAVDEDATLSVPAPGVLGNDTDAENNAFTAVPASITTSAGATVELAADGSFTYLFDPANDYFGEDAFSYQAIETLDPYLASNTATVQITVRPVNDAPSFTLIDPANQGVNEDSGAQSVPAFLTGSNAGPANELDQTLTVSVSNANAALFSVQPAIDLATGDLSYTPAANANGSAVVTVSVTDNGGTANGGNNTSPAQTFTITVNPVNDAPSFTKGSDVIVTEDSGAYSAAAWATSLSAGPANESGQTPLTFTVVAANPGLFSAGPAISATGELSFTPAADVTGFTSVTVSVTDTGGVANGGVDTSPTQTFNISINAINDAPVVALVSPLANYTEGDGAVGIDAGPSSFTVIDLDNAFLAGMRVRITTGAEVGVDTLACPACAALGISQSYVGSTLTLSGTATVAEYEAALRSVTFTNLSDTPSGSDRELTVTANDGALLSTPVTMTFTFTVTGDIIIVKDAVPDDPQDFAFTENITTGGGFFALDDDADPTLSNTITFNNVVPDAYEVSETVADGWDLTGLNCDDSDSIGSTFTGIAAIVVEEYETVTCTFTNNNLGTIEIIKNTNPDDPQDFGFTEDITGGAGSFTLDDDADATLSNSETFEFVKPGTYNVTEAPPEAGWDLTDIVCSSTSTPASTFTYLGGADTGDNQTFEPGDTTAVVALAFGDDTVSCTFTNTEQGTITIVDDTVPDADQDFGFTENIPTGSGTFILNDGGGIPSVPSTTFKDVAPGVYSVTQTTVPGWTLSSIVCTTTAKPASTFSYAGAAVPTDAFEPGDTTATITLAPGDDTVSCTFTNTEQGTIAIVENTVPDDDQAFGFTADVPTGPASFSLNDGPTAPNTTEIFTAVEPGVYAVTQTVQAGWELTGIDCGVSPSADGSTFTYTGATPGTDLFEAGDTTANITLVAGDDDVSCEFTNTDVRGAIVITKDVQPDSLQSFGFGETITASPAVTSFDLVDNGTDPNSQAFSNVAPGTYNVTESPVAGWLLSGIACSASPATTFEYQPSEAAAFQPGDTGVDIDLAPADDSVSCTFTNTQDGSITIVTESDPQDGTNFEFNPGGAFGAEPNFFLDDEAVQPNDTVFNSTTFTGLQPGTYSVLEIVPTGWELATPVCVSSNPGPDTAANIDLAAGESVTCTFTNTKDAFIVIDKVTDPVGDPAEFDFDASWLGDNLAPESDVRLTDAGEPFESGDLDPGGYTVTELVETGWVPTGSVCVSSIGDPDEAPSAISLQAGETVTCTFTNSKDGSITVVKSADPADGTDFEFVPGGDFVAEPNFFLDDEAAQPNGDSGNSIEFSALQPGTFSVAEIAQAGWELTDTTCVSSIGDTETAGGIELDAGEDVTCTFTNTKLATITVAKETLPDGDPTSFAFTGDIEATLADGESSVALAVLPGEFTVNEGAVLGWALTDITCDDPGSTGDTGTSTATFNVDAGENVTCTFTNTKLGTITVAKETLPDGDATSFGFTGAITTSLADGESSVALAVLPGEFTVTEGAVRGWALTDITCDDPGPFGSTGDTGTSTATFNVEAGENVTCTFTNTKLGTITVAKETLPDGDPTSFAFTGNIEATLADGESSVALAVLPGDYTVTESTVTDWDLTDITCDDGDSTGDILTSTATFNVQAGEDVTCTFTNASQGAIHIIEDTQPDGPQNFNFANSGGSPATFTLDDDAGLGGDEALFSNTRTYASVAPGVYTINQSTVAGWDLSNIACEGTASFLYQPSAALSFQPGDTGVTITFVTGQSAGCTFTNTEQAQITVTKVQIPQTGQNFNFDASWLTIDPPPGASDFILDVDPAGSPDPLYSPSRTFLDLTPGLYSVTEIGEGGWDLSALTCTSDNEASAFTYSGAALGSDDYEDGDDAANIVLAPGDQVTCTFTNDEASTITVLQNTVPDHDEVISFDETIVGTGFTLFDDGNPVNSTKVFEGVARSTYSVTQPAIAGFVLSNIACSSTGGSVFTYTGAIAGADAFEPGDTTANIVLAGADDTVTCEFTTQDNRGTIAIVENTEPDGSQAFGFEENITDFVTPTPFDLVDDGTPSRLATFGDVLPTGEQTGAYSVSATPVSGWVLTDITCGSLGGSTFEYQPSGLASFADGDNQVDIDLAAADDSASCTFTNTSEGSITFTKASDPAGGTGFSFDPSDNLSLDTFDLDDALSETFSALQPGTYSAAELTLQGWDLTGIDCTVANANPVPGSATYGGDGTFDLGLDSDATVALAAGENWTCTFTNTADANIVVDKVTDPTGDLASFGFDASWLGANAPLESDVQLTDAGEPFDSGDLDPGTYSVTELAQPGWELTGTSCVSSLGGTETAGDIELDAGETVTCTFTNTKDGSVTFVKQADPEDGTNFVFDPSANLGPDDFFLDDEAVQSDGVAQSRTFAELQPGTYSASELVASGWDLTGIACAVTNSNGGSATYGGDATFDLGSDTDATVDLAAGEDWTCTFTNTKDAMIVVDKVTDPVGDETVFDFEASWNTGPSPAFTLTDEGTPVNSGDLDPGTYSVTELPEAGWDLTSTVCLSSLGGTELAGAIDLNAGEIVTCTFTNTKDANIVVDKVTDPAGDTTVFDFDASWNAGPSPAFTLTDAGTPVDSGDLDPGTYSVTELLEAGWDATGAACESSNREPDEDPANISLQAGETVTCTFENTKRGTIRIVKDVIGPDAAFSFNENITGAGGSFVATTAGGSVTTTFLDVPAGSYTVKETPLPGEWKLTGLSCVSANDNSKFALTGSAVDTVAYETGDDTAAIDLAPGDTATCTFTNTDPHGSITVVKNSGASAGSFSFTETIENAGFILVTGEPGRPGEPGGPGGPGLATKAFTEVHQGTYTIEETAVPGWRLSNIACTSSRGLSTFVYAGATAFPTNGYEAGDDRVFVTFGADADKVSCTFTNVDERGTITVIEDTVPDSGQLFTYSQNIAGSDGFMLADSSFPFPNVLPGSGYSVTQTLVPGFSLTNIACTSTGGSTFTYTGAVGGTNAFQAGDTTANITLAAGDTSVRCTFTNTDRRGTIVIIQDTVPDNAQDFVFTHNVGAGGSFTLDDDLDLFLPNTITFSNVLAGTYTFTQTQVPNWIVSSLSCNDANSTGNTGTRRATIRVEQNETVTCTFVNRRTAPL